MISLNWVKDYIDIENENLNDLAVKITEAGINVEKIISHNIDNLVVGEVVKCTPHPDSDHLNVCQVNIGKEELQQIVCGAHNVKDGLKVIVALPGAVLPGDFTIKQSKIRGVESNGMICALFELGLEEKTEENYNKGIEELDIDAPVGEDALKYLGYDDTVYELDVHKHRNNDCYYHIGFAYEIGAVLNKKVTLPDTSHSKIEDDINNHFSVEVKTPKCPYYLAKMVVDAKIGESPEFIKRRLISAGMRPINNIVDISNYVMLEFGQPLHFFDKDKVGNKILVRDALDDEEITTLDGKVRTLKSSDIVITDGNVPVCVAGVMGGANTEVDSNTKNILIESAIFDAVSIRYTAAGLDLKSEASIRYGKGLNYEYTNMAIERACHLLEKYADAKILTGTIKHDVIEKQDKIIKFTKDEINKMLGITIDQKDMEVELNRLDFPYTIEDGKFIVTVPKRRLDIDSNVNDIAEEIGRLYGYKNLVSTLPTSTMKKGGYVGDVKYRKLISKRLRALGLNEVKTYTLVSSEIAKMFNYEDKKQVVLPNPMSMDKSVVRTTLLPSLLNVYNYNKTRKVEDIFIYEISKTYDISYNEDSKVSILMKGNYLNSSWGSSLKVDFYLLKGIVENLFDYMGLKNRYSFEKNVINDLHPGISCNILLDRKVIGVMGKVHPNTTKDDIYVCEFSMNALMSNIKPLKYKSVSKYPSINKDMGFIMDKEIPAEDVIRTIKRAGGKTLVSVVVFDIYTGQNIGENKKSIAFNLEFNDENKTLNDNEVMETFNKIIKEVETKHNATLRDQ